MLSKFLPVYHDIQKRICDCLIRNRSRQSPHRLQHRQEREKLDTGSGTLAMASPPEWEWQAAAIPRAGRGWLAQAEQLRARPGVGASGLLISMPELQIGKARNLQLDAAACLHYISF